MRDIHISIVSHGQGHYVGRLLANLAARPSAARYQVTLVQNIAEPDDRAPEPHGLPLRVIRNARPCGFGENHNRAFHEPPLAAGRRCFVVLNPDVELQGDVLGALAGRLQTIAKIGVIAPSVRSPGGAREDSARSLPTPRRLLGKLFGASSVWPVDDPQRPYAPDWVAGMCLLFPCTVFERIGGFDERYFLYYEDVDICSRLWLAGYSVWVDPAQAIVHEAQRSSRRQWRYARWHLASIVRFLTSPVYRQVRHLHRQRVQG